MMQSNPSASQILTQHMQGLPHSKLISLLKQHTLLLKKLLSIQKTYYDKIQKDVSTRDTCGKPGVNGGYFDNKDLKFGVNCYGVKPKPNPDNIVYLDDNDADEKIDDEVLAIESKNDKNEKLINKYKKKFKNKYIDLTPFNNSKWSTYSFKKSEYIIPSINSYQGIVSEVSVNSEDKDPNSYQSVVSEMPINSEDKDQNNS